MTGETRRSLADLLAEDGPPDEVLVHVTGDTPTDCTRAELVARADAIALGLRTAGARPGQPVAVSLPNGPDVVAALFGVWRAGAVYVPVNPLFTDGETAAVLAAARPAVAVASPALLARAPDRFGGLTVLGPHGTVLRASAGSPASPGGAATEPGPHDPDIALIQTTSGTTGRPKPVLLRHSGVLTLLDGVIGSLRSGAASGRPPMPNIIPVSLSLWAGIYQVLFAFRVGAPVIVMPRFNTTDFAAAVRRFGIRSAVLPPAAMTMLADDEAVTSLEPLRYVRGITAPLSPRGARRFRDRFGISIMNCYGQTEIGGEIVGWNAADVRAHGEAKLGSVGRPHEGVSVRAAGPDGAVLPADSPGELQVRTPALSAGYADGADLSDRLTADGWFRTGDVGRVDPDGFVWIEGRLSEMINRGGLKIFPAEVAEVLRLSPDVADAAVVGVPDERLGQVPWAFVVPRGPAVDPDALRALCREHLAPYKIPVRFADLAELPRNEIGKIRTGELVALAVRPAD